MKPLIVIFVLFSFFTVLVQVYIVSVLRIRELNVKKKRLKNGYIAYNRLRYNNSIKPKIKILEVVNKKSKIFSRISNSRISDKN